jgi:hypothetical protein
VIDDEPARYRKRFARTLDGRWATMGIRSGDPAYGVWVFRGNEGHREAKGSHESFRVTWTGDCEIEIEWANGDVDSLAYQFELASDTTRQVSLSTRGRAVFAFGSVPLVRLDAF